MSETTTMIDPKALLEAEIKRKQGELSFISVELGKAEVQRNAVKVESDKLHLSIEKSNEELSSVLKRIKKAEEDFKIGNARSVALLEARDKESEARQVKAERAEASAQEILRKASQAKNNLAAIAEDMGKTVMKIEGFAVSLKHSVCEELKGYLALRDLKAEIPEVKKK